MRCVACGLDFAAGSTASAGDSEIAEWAEPTVRSLASRLPAGTVLASRYRILEVLGQGGMGTVYKAYDVVLGEVVGLKLLKTELLEDPKMAERFKSEIRLARKVRHRNVCAIHEFGESEHGPFISMEFVDGGDIKRLLRERGALPPRQAFALAIQVAEGLQAIHEAGIVHRDVKPSNLMLDSTGNVRVMDFGIAKREGEGSFTSSGALVGTPEYISPEQAKGGRVDPRCDVYSLGAVAFELFTGRPPFRGKGNLAVILKHLNEEPPLDDPLLPPGVRSVLARALAKEPSVRYGTAKAVARALQSAEGAIETPPVELAAPPQHRSSRRRVLVAGVAVLAVAAALLVGLWRRAPGPPQPAEVASNSPAVSAPVGSLLVVARPWGDVFIDGKQVGTTPLDWIRVPAGEHVLRVRHPTYGSREQRVNLGSGEKKKVVVDLSSPEAR